MLKIYAFMKKTLLAVLIMSFFSVCSRAQTGYAVRQLKDELYFPWEMVEGPDNNIWYTEKDGRISRINPATGQTKELLRLGDVHLTNGEGGLLGLALHPDFSDTPRVYFAYNYLDNSLHREKVVIYEYANDTLTYYHTIIDTIQGAIIHNGCRLLIKDRKLYVTTGDAAESNLAQDLGSVNGKVLRFNLDGTIPADNPLPGSPVWTFGHRNAQGLCLVDDKLFSSEHGASTDDEINIIEGNRNYGWPEVEGYCNTSAEAAFCIANNVKEPIRAWTPTLAVCGIDYYNHALFPQWQNSLIMATLKDSKLYSLPLNAAKDSVTGQVEITNINKGRLRDVLVTSDGKIYFSTSNSSPSIARDGIYEIYIPTPSGIDGRNSAVPVTVWPNPLSGKVCYLKSAGHAASLDVRVTSLTGRRVTPRVSQTSEGLRIDFSGWSKGLYFLQVRSRSDGSLLAQEKIVLN